MKYFILFIFILILCGLFDANAQDQDKIIIFGNTLISTSGKINKGSIDSCYTFKPESINLNSKDQSDSDCLSSNYIFKSKKTHPKFILPIKLKDGLTEENFYTITAYVDHDSLNPDYLKDYMCGDLTYDHQGYNHSGTDFSLWPFPWHKMYNDEVEVVAAAPGMLYYKQDGNFDQNCEENSEPWNGVAVLHEDGSTSWYIHMKKNSVTQKNVGEAIEQGEYLGIVGSSGSSIAPHLHFEVHDPYGNPIDPFIGPCNTSISESWWLNQIAYKEPGVNKICTNAHLPFFGNCPDEEITNEQNVFNLGDTVYLMSYITNISLNDTVVISLLKPDNSLFTTWSWFSPWDFYPSSWLYFYFIPEGVETGTWNYQFTYKSKTYGYPFEIKKAQGVIMNQHPARFKYLPNPAHDWIELRFDDLSFRPDRAEIITPLGKVIPIDFTISQKNSFKVYLGNFKPGIYFLKFYSRRKMILSKVIKD